MVAMPNRSVLTVLLSDADRERDPASAEETAAPAAPEREVSEEQCRESVTYPDWRREELARKYSDDEPIERERGFYHPYG